MVAREGAPYRSANAGELSPDAAGRADIKQFYSAGLRFKGIEPVPLSGFRRMAGSFDLGPVRGRMAVLPKTNEDPTPGPHTGTKTIWQASVVGKVVAIDCTAVAADTGAHTVHAEALVGGNWVAFGSPIPVSTTTQQLTFAAAPGAGLVATQARLRATMSVAASINVGVVTVLNETAIQDNPRYASLLHDSGLRYHLSLQAQFLDVFEDDAFVAGVYLPTLTSAILPFVGFYAENATVGIGQLNLETLRVRRSGSSAAWTRDLWPYDGIPTADLGAVYPKTDDKWEVQVQYTGTPIVYLTLTVDGETTPGVPFVDAGGVPIAISGAVDVALTAANIKAALETLPSLSPTITVVVGAIIGTSRRIDITFGGALTGSEYQLVSLISNTAVAAALASHIQIGKTDFEPALSTLRGWPGVFGLAQDRLAYGDVKAVPGAVSFSQAGEYFTLDIEASGANAARFDKLRAGQVAERVLGFAEATYFLVFTNKGVHFAANRTINATDPLNFTETASDGVPPNCDAMKLENKIYYVGVNPKSEPPVGDKILSLRYSELETSFEATPEHIFATHLIEGIIRSKPQKASSKSEASSMWLMRDDGRLIAGKVIISQEVLGFCEWVAAAAGLVREIHVDAGNDLRMAVSRGGVLRHERQDRATFFQATVLRTPDLAGRVSKLELFEGLSVWAHTQEGFCLGPFTVSGAAIDLGDAYAGDVMVGLWQAPVWESMPRYYITRNDEVIKRPGRIHRLDVAVIDTTSIAIGANSEAIEDVALGLTSNQADLPQPGVSKTVARFGMLGQVIGTTAVISQVKPGELYVRDINFGEKL